MTTAILGFMAVQVALGLASAKYAADCHAKQRVAEIELVRVRRENDELHKELERNNTAYRHAYDRPGVADVILGDEDHH